MPEQERVRPILLVVLLVVRPGVQIHLAGRRKAPAAETSLAPTSQLDSTAARIRQKRLPLPVR